MIWKPVMLTRAVLAPLLLAGGLAVSLAAPEPAEAHGHKSMKQRTLYERLGGQKAIVAVVDDFVGNVAKDKRINGFFGNTNIPRLKRLLVEQICAGSGGPCTYTGRDMKTTHRGMGVNNGHFNALVEDLGMTLKKFRVPAREQRELVAILAPMRKDIVERKYR